MSLTRRGIVCAANALVLFRTGLHAVPLPVCVVLAEFAFEELAGGGIGKLGDGDEVVGNLPPCETELEEGAEFGRVDGAVFGDDDSQWAFIPLGMRDGYDGGFADGVVSDERVRGRRS